jgi:uracil-DNA glycosylase
MGPFHYHPSWSVFMNEQFEAPYFVKLADFLKAEYASQVILPARNEVFNAFRAVAFEDVRVVILGQDPYPTPGHAHGLCFSVKEDVRPIPKSLRNIFLEIQDDLGISFPANGNLERWSRQGVFLLNTVLTVRAGEPQSHAGKGWELFTDEVIRKLNELPTRVVFLLWGSKAQSKKELIDLSKHVVLEAPHPSPLSAHRGFLGCKHFSQTNLLLKEVNLPPIEW